MYDNKIELKFFISQKNTTCNHFYTYTQMILVYVNKTVKY